MAPAGPATTPHRGPSRARCNSSPARALPRSFHASAESHMASGSHHPPQEQDRQPGRQEAMRPAPRAEMRDYRGTGRLAGKAALISGGDSGIGRAVAIGFAKEGADLAIVYLEEHEDPEATKQMVERYGCRCLLIEG